MSLNLKSLIGKLTESARRALEGAVGMCVSRTHSEVDLEHWLAKMLEPADGDAQHIFRHFGVDPTRVLRDLNRALDLFKTGSSRRPELAPEIEQLVREGWVFSSINLGLARVRSGAIVLAAFTDPVMRRRLVDIHRDLAAVNAEALSTDFAKIVETSAETREVLSLSAGAEREVRAASGAAAGGQTPALDQYTVDLTASARAGRIDPVLGRDAEIRQVVDISW
jgi:type VI secretion system protein VasG